MRRVRWIAHETRLNSLLLQRGKDLFALLNIATQIPLAVDDQGRSRHLLEIRDRRLPPKLFDPIEVAPGYAFEVAVLVKRKVAIARHRNHVRYAAVRDCGLEVLRVA